MLCYLFLQVLKRPSATLPRISDGFIDGVAGCRRQRIGAVLVTIALAIYVYLHAKQGEGLVWERSRNERAGRSCPFLSPC